MKIILATLLSALLSFGQRPSYGGGPILNDPNGTIIYALWYGNWQTWPAANVATTTIPIMENFLRQHGASERWKLVTQWADSAGKPIVNKLRFGGSYYDPAKSQGNSINVNSRCPIIDWFITNRGIPLSDKVIYYIFVSGDGITDPPPDAGWLAYHGSCVTNSGLRVAYATQKAITSSPYAQPWLQADWWTDYVIQVTAHEIDETSANPFIGVNQAWSEVDQHCQYNYTGYLLTAPLPNNAGYTHQYGSYYYRISKQHWIWGNYSSSSPTCYMEYPTTLSGVVPFGTSSALKGVTSLKGLTKLK